MNAVLSPLVSEFETQEKADSYNVWLQAKLEHARTSTKPSIPHDRVMAQARALLELKRKAHAVD